MTLYPNERFFSLNGSGFLLKKTINHGYAIRGIRILAKEELLLLSKGWL
jgi:hypothetical protein